MAQFTETPHRCGWIEKVPNKLASGNAGIASRLTIGNQLPGVPDPGRSVKLQLHFVP
jgi:hypothetical protein